MLPEETAKDVNYPQYHHNTTQHCCTGCANTSLAWVPLLSQVPLICTAEGATQESLKAEKHTGKRVKSTPSPHACDADWQSVGWAQPTPLQSIAAGHSKYCWDPEIPVGMFLQALMDPVEHCVIWPRNKCSLSQKQLQLLQQKDKTHRKGSKAKLRDFFRTANTEQFPCIQSQLLRHYLWFVSLFNCLNMDISVKLKIPSLSGLNLILILWVNVRWTKISSPKFAEVLNIRNSWTLKWRKYFDTLKCSVTHIHDSWQAEGGQGAHIQIQYTENQIFWCMYRFTFMP